MPLEQMIITANRYARSWPIRVVIDDFSSLRNIFPELREDPLLFPSILFHLEREGVTTLIIDTQSGKPETTIVERFETELRQMVHHRLYTWRVPFYGESRVAIAAIPPLSYEYAGIVRELRWETEPKGSDNREPATVDPHFELYSGLEEGKPEAVPLHARFYAETPAMEEYIGIENSFLGEMFSSYPHPANTGPPTIIFGMTPPGYEDLRALAYLQRDTRLDYTFLFQVDEFWAVRAPSPHKRAGAFEPQWSYLDAITATSNKPQPDNAGDYAINPYADPYELFQLRRDPSRKLEIEANSPQLRRRHFYEEYYKDFERYDIFETGHKEKYHLDRVPFSWDFGFLLCQERAWKDNSRGLTIEHPDGKKQHLTVQDVWRLLVKAEPEEPSAAQQPSSKESPAEQKPVSWRIFIEACKKAAEEQSAILAKPVTAFDFAQISPESFSCLLLEIWFSEIYDHLVRCKNKSDQTNAYNLKQILSKITKRQLFIPAHTEEHNKNFGQAIPAKLQNSDDEQDPLKLSELLRDFRWELYKSWLLLIEVINLSDIIGEGTVSTFDLKSKNTDFCAVASRHWYKTATQCPDEIASKEPLIPVRLPGRFSARGDWFLAVSGGSRSIRQAERALDLLSSRRANITRLQMGVGLPTRVTKSIHPEQGSRHGTLFTKLLSHQRGHDNLEYDAFLKIAAKDDQGFYWLWRSSLDGYAQCNRIWHRWINRTLLWWHRKLLRYRSAWRNSFELYDALTKSRYDSSAKFAPTRQELRDKQNQVKAAESPEEKNRLEEEFISQYTHAHSFAQLYIRREFLELLDSLIEELEQVPVASER